MAPILNSISPTAGPPGTVITLVGAGFDPGARVAAPTLAPTTFVSSTQLTALVQDVKGGAGEMVPIGVLVVNEDGSRSTGFLFQVLLPRELLQAWTSVDAVVGEVPGFQRGGQITDRNIQTWITSVSQAIAGAMMRRGLPVDASGWTQPDTAGMPSPASVLEMIARLGAAARLASACASQFGSGEWALAKNLASSYGAEIVRLENGGYDKLFKPSAATIEAGPQLSAGDMTDDSGGPSNAFTKGKIF